jgi:hypothetical protein
MAISSRHPTPWRVAYSRKCKEWHEKSCPKVIDASGCLVVAMPQHVEHPGMYDQVSDNAAHLIVTCMNERAEILRNWIHEDELPESYDYDGNYDKSQVIYGVRMFPR